MVSGGRKLQSADRQMSEAFITSIFLALMRLGDTPVPIPNTTVKTQEADGTALETVWESRWMPDYMGL